DTKADGQKFPAGDVRGEKFVGHRAGPALLAQPRPARALLLGPPHDRQRVRDRRSTVAADPSLPDGNLAERSLLQRSETIADRVLRDGDGHARALGEPRET